MFTDIGLFNNDKQKFYEELRELNMTDIEDKDKKVKEINNKFRDTIRKYLPTCLNIINTNYGCQFSLYKVGKDFDAAFKVIETNVKKSRAEVETELANYQSMSNYNSFNEETKDQIDLASEILATYVDDSFNIDVNKMQFLERATAKTSSIITNVPRMSQEAISSNDEASQEIQYNPYANTPIGLDNEFAGPDISNDNVNNTEPDIMSNDSSKENLDALDKTNFSMDIFYRNGQ